MTSWTHKGFGVRGERKFDLIEKPAAPVTVEKILDAGRKSRHHYANLKAEVAEQNTMGGRGLIAAMLEDEQMRSTPMPLEDFLIEIRGWGASKVVEVCQLCGVAADTPLRELSLDQVARLVKRLRRKERK